MSTPTGEVFGPSGLDLPSGLPAEEGIEAARTSGATDIRTVDVQGTPVRVLSRPIQRAGFVYVLQVGQDITAERNTVNTLITVLAVGGPRRDPRGARRRLGDRPPGARADPRCAPPPARVRRRREPRASDAAGRRPGQRGAPPAQPGQAGPRGRHGGRRHHGRDRSPDRPRRRPPPPGPERLGGRRARPRAGRPGRRRRRRERLARRACRPIEGVGALDPAPVAGHGRRCPAAPARHDPRRQRNRHGPVGGRCWSPSGRRDARRP